MIQPGLFNIERRLETLSKFGDLLEKLKEVVNFEVFRKEIKIGLGFSDRSKRGRPYDAVLILRP